MSLAERSVLPAPIDGGTGILGECIGMCYRVQLADASAHDSAGDFILLSGILTLSGWGASGVELTDT